MRLTRWLTLRLFGVTALVAVGSFWWQLPGLSGSHGIVPAQELMAALRGPAADVSLFEVPTLFWLSASDGMLHAVAALAFLSALAVALNLAPRAALVVLWLAWLSLVQVARPWLGFQWDVMLVESAFVLFFFAPNGLRPRLAAEPEPAPATRWLLAAFACKVTFASGIVKVLGGDPAWRDLSALTYHWWSQPLPTWTSVLAAQWPLSVQQLLCLGVFALELPIPLLALGPRPARLVAAGGLLTLQLGLFVSGNYSYYNLLAAALVLPLLDDAALESLWPKRRAYPRLPAAPPRVAPRWHLALVATYVLFSVFIFLGRRGPGAPLTWLVQKVAVFDTINAYGAFAVMTKSRPEIVFEGTNDGVTWLPYELPWKPGRVDRRPTFVAPLHPRLDWQLWFASLGECADSPWLAGVQRHLLLGTTQVLALFEDNPFTGAPPKVLRTRVFEYRFAPLSQQGVWWTRTEVGPFCPPVTLSPDGRLMRAELP